ncbi:MAG TPA: hypothetical protein VMW82_00455 [Candidatus Paceibacterota bacterium]|nr:hypothetical protein [Candidatus Paceibacterota bacterium]
MKKIYKEIILGVAVVLLGLFAWYFLRYVFYVGGLTAGCWILGGILFILFGIALCLAMLLIKNKAILFSSIGLTLVLFFIFFHNEPFYYLIVLILLFLAFMAATRKIKKEEEIQANLDYWRIWKRGLPIFITTLILLISVVYYFSPGLISKRDARISVSDEIIDSVLKPLEDKISVGIINASKNTVYNLIDKQLNNLVEPFRYLIPLGLAVGLFLSLKLVSLFYVPIVIMLSWLAIKILIKLKFVKSKKIQKEVESVSL